MLAAEEARASLLAIYDDEWLTAAQRRVRKLKRTLRRLSEPLVAAPPTIHDPSLREKRRKQLMDTAAGLDQLGAQQLTQVMSALHPKMGSTLAAWWEAAKGHPYSVGWNRRAFRAPTNPELTRDTRIDDLNAMLLGAGPYDRPPEWFAAWAPFLNVADSAAPPPHRIGPFLAAAIDEGGPSGDATYKILVESGFGDHPTGGMGRHVIVGLLRSSREDGWAFVEAMLLAAQRQEGLRQTILEAADEAHPEAFSRIIGLVLQEDLLRFAATIRAVSVWFGFTADAEHLDEAKRRVKQLQAFRSNRNLARKQVLGGDAWDTYVGLCAIAQFDVAPAVELALEAVKLPDRDNRAAALRFLASTMLEAPSISLAFVAATTDTDLAVASLGHRYLVVTGLPETDAHIHEPLKALAQRLPAKTMTAEPIGIDPEPVVLDRGAVVASMVHVVGARPLEPLLAFLPSMRPETRAELAGQAGERSHLDGDLRATLVRLVGDRSSHVRDEAVKALSKFRPDVADAPELERLLTRKSGKLRSSVIGLLSRLPVPDAADAAKRLWSGDQPQRDAACELLSVIERTAAVVAVSAKFLGDAPSSAQRDVLDLIVLGDESPVDDPTLGLYRPNELTPPRVPRGLRKGRRFSDETAFQIADRLDDLAEKHRDVPFEYLNWQGSTEVLLGDAQGLPSPFSRAPGGVTEGGHGMILPEVFRTWWDERGREFRGESDQLDALRALVVVELCAHDEGTPRRREFQPQFNKLFDSFVGRGRLRLRHPEVVVHVLHWIIADIADESLIDECVDAAEVSLAAVPRTWFKQLPGPDDDWRAKMREWRDSFAWSCTWIRLTTDLLQRDPLLLGPDHLARWYGLMRWFDQPISGVQRYRVQPAVMLQAHAIGAASDADVYETFMAEPDHSSWGVRRLLSDFTKRRREQLVDRYPTVVPLADRVRERVIEIERSRGEVSTPASHVALNLASISGADVAFELLARLGRSTLVRGDRSTSGGREAVYSHLIQISHPAAGDTPESLRRLIEKYGIKDRRLVELAMFAPHWAPMLETVLEWDGLDDAVWWFHVHTKDDQWSVEVEVRETWAALSAERTSLGSTDLTEGAVDVEWFDRAHSRLGAERWSTLQKSAKLASIGSAHRRAQIFAEAMLGDISESDVVKRLQTKRHQDSVRSLGLLPLPDEGAEMVALSRYQVLREFERGSKKFGQQRQRSEALAVRIGIDNLARNLGYLDPQRFIWAMEAAEAGDLSDGPISVTVDGVVVTLHVNGEGIAQISAQRGDKRLKSVPAKLRKQPEIKALTDRRTALKRQASRVRRSLEDAMIRQDRFIEGDFKALNRHPVVAPMLDLLIWVDDDAATYRRSDGLWLDVHSQPAIPAGAMRIAHPVDLLASGSWIQWQQQFFDNADRQPFKQVFRELYVRTASELADSPVSRRWSGHQLQLRQASGLFTARGWLSDRESSEVAKVYHHCELVARVGFVDGWGTPAEVELPTVDTVYFAGRGEYLAQPLDSVPAIIFSETMRDLDLVVSVAHAGGVDPEASASTVEMRAALVRETARIMSLDNVRQESSHIVIEGTLGEYSVHLGSGTVHRRPGGALCIIPVDAQRRGRIFLPFADDDPKTAEIVSKILMLARDSKIKDPTILEQLRS